MSFALEQTGSDWERRFRLLAGNTRALVSLHDADGTFRFASDAVSELTGMPAESLEGSPVLGVIHPGDGHRVLEAMSAWLSGVGPRGASYRMLAASGGWVEVESSFSAAGGPEVLWTTRRLDIVGSGPGRAPETDAATGLPTRQALLERLEWALHPAGEGEVAVLVIRIEGLLAIVAEHGRAAADLIVRELGRHVDAVLRPADMVGRLGAGRARSGLPRRVDSADRDPHRGAHARGGGAPARRRRAAHQRRDRNRARGRRRRRRAPPAARRVRTRLSPATASP